VNTRIQISIFTIFLLMLACNLPAGAATQPSEVQTPLPEVSVDTVATSVESTIIAGMTLNAGSAVPQASATATLTETMTPTQCVPSVTATANANVRRGPDIAFEVVGNLLIGSTATVAGRNDANTWWYINFPGGDGGYAWIAGSVVSTSCLPQVVQVVAGPPTPILPTATKTLPPPVAGVPDLVASGMQYWPSPARNNQPISIQVKVTNSGNAPAGSFTVVWLSNQDIPGCDWSVQGLGVGASKNLECEFTYNGNDTASYWTTLVVDTGGAVAESNEGNNSRDMTLKVSP
jgi:hypothetical protein